MTLLPALVRAVDGFRGIRCVVHDMDTVLDIGSNAAFVALLPALVGTMDRLRRIRGVINNVNAVLDLAGGTALVALLPAFVRVVDVGYSIGGVTNDVDALVDIVHFAAGLVFYCGVRSSGLRQSVVLLRVVLGLVLRLGHMLRWATLRLVLRFYSVSCRAAFVFVGVVRLVARAVLAAVTLRVREVTLTAITVDTLMVVVVGTSIRSAVDTLVRVWVRTSGLSWLRLMVLTVNFVVIPERVGLHRGQVKEIVFELSFAVLKAVVCAFNGFIRVVTVLRDVPSGTKGERLTAIRSSGNGGCSCKRGSDDGGGSKNGGGTHRDLKMGRGGS